jgi:hypothetical protein
MQRNRRPLDHSLGFHSVALVKKVMSCTVSCKSESEPWKENLGMHFSTNSLNEIMVFKIEEIHHGVHELLIKFTLTHTWDIIRENCPNINTCHDSVLHAIENS